MIKLINLLKEIQNGSKKAIIMAGAAGVGKGTFITNVKNKYPQAKILNPDDFYIPKLKEKGVSLDLKNVFKSSPESISKAAQAMGSARGDYEKEIQSSLDNPILIFDITSNSYGPIVKLKTRLEESGYEVMMVYLYAPLATVLKRNDSRYLNTKGEDRSIQPTAVLDTWKGVTENFDNYKQLFGDNFIASTTDDSSVTSESFEELKKKYIEPYTPSSKTIDLPKEVEDDFNEKIKSLGLLNPYEIRKLKQKALEFYTKNKNFMPLSNKKPFGFKENLNSIKKQFEKDKEEKKEFLKLLEPNNPIIKNIIDNSKTKDEVLNKTNEFLKK